VGDGTNFWSTGENNSVCVRPIPPPNTYPHTHTTDPLGCRWRLAPLRLKVTRSYGDHSPLAIAAALEG
jgi:hypothetical protein